MKNQGIPSRTSNPKEKSLRVIEFTIQEGQKGCLSAAVVKGNIAILIPNILQENEMQCGLVGGWVDGWRDSNRKKKRQQKNDNGIFLLILFARVTKEWYFARWY